jgi:osmotically-inducible protein OsmY
MRDACITAKARAALFAHPKIGHIPLDIQTENGVVRVSSEALTAPWDGLARDVIQKIDGVSGVQFEEFEMPMPTRLA